MNILAFHAIERERRDPVSTVRAACDLNAAVISERLFRGIITALAENGWRGMRLDQAMETDDPHVFALTVDDAQQSALSIILPACERLGWTGTVSTPVGLVGHSGKWDSGSLRNQRHLDWDELQHMVHAGWEIGSHGVSHRALTDMRPSEARRELEASRDVLEQKLDVCVRSIAYPFGAVNTRVARMARDAGYEFGITMHPGKADERADALRLPRWPVYWMDSPAHVLAKLCGPAWLRGLQITRDRLIQSFSRGTRVVMQGRSRIARTRSD
jgi:peptidoglycan/xylan/chitin deacetylase (PgdA/CDA1 family)